MGRKVQTNPLSEEIPTTVLLAHSGNAGTTKEYNFLDGSIKYFERTLRNSFDYTMIDNIGNGLVRISYNRPAIDISNYTDGAKTMKSGDSFYIGDEAVSSLKIYFVENSTVEVVLKSDKDV